MKMRTLGKKSIKTTAFRAMAGAVSDAFRETRSRQGAEGASLQEGKHEVYVNYGNPLCEGIMRAYTDRVRFGRGAYDTFEGGYVGQYFLYLSLWVAPSAIKISETGAVEWLEEPPPVDLPASQQPKYNVITFGFTDTFSGLSGRVINPSDSTLLESARAYCCEFAVSPPDFFKATADF